MQQQLRPFEAFFVILGLLLLVGAGGCGLYQVGSVVAAGFAVAGGLCFLSAAVMYTKPSVPKSKPAQPLPRPEIEDGSPAESHTTIKPQ
jgi:hypothetical protein